MERLAWDHFSPHRLLASTDQGQVVCVDLRWVIITIIIIVIVTPLLSSIVNVRNDSKPVWTLSAHSEAVTGLALSSQCPGCLVTTSQV